MPARAAASHSASGHPPEGCGSRPPGRLVAVEAERRAREALTATAADLHAAGRSLGDILDELVDAE
jgi:hypothetical protein